MRATVIEQSFAFDNGTMRYRCHLYIWFFLLMCVSIINRIRCENHIEKIATSYAPFGCMHSVCVRNVRFDRMNDSALGVFVNSVVVFPL